MCQISVIVPIYKVEKYIHRCVDSILAQTFRDFDLILVDDGSPDRCGVICDEYAEKDSRIVVIHQRNAGAAAARNAGIDWSLANSDSEWLAFVDSDDWVHPRFLEVLYQAVQDTEAKISVCGFERTIGKSPEVNETALKAQVCSPEALYCEPNGDCVIPVNKLYCKSCWAEIRFPVGKMHEDEYTTYKVLFKCSKVAVVDQPLYAYYQNPEGAMRGLPWDAARFEMILEALNARYSFFASNGFERARKKTKARIREVRKQNQRRKIDFVKHIPNLVLLTALGEENYENLKDKLRRK